MVKVHEAGQVGLVEWILILIGVLWLAGYLRNIIYVPVVIKETEKKEDPSNETKIAENVTLSKPGKDKNDGDYVAFEEVKD